MRGFVLALLPLPHLVDDVVQETFVTACAKAEVFVPGTNFRAWIFAIARNKVLAAVKRHARRAEVLDPELVEQLVAEVPDDTHDDARKQALAECIQRLSASSRRAITLRYGEALGPTEVARQMGWTLNAVHVALSRTRVALRRCVETRVEST